MRAAALALAVVALGSALLSIPRAEAAVPGGPQQVIQFVGLLGGWSARNKVYREAREYSSEVKAQHDALREKAREQLRERKVTGSLAKESQLAAYVKLVGLIERERTASVDLIESEKRAARSQFLNQLKSAALGVLAGSKIGRDTLGAMRGALSGAKGDVEAALAGTSEAGAVLAKLRKASKTLAAAGLLAEAVGGPGGKRVGDALRRTIDAANQPEAALDEVRTKLDEGLAELDRIEGVPKRPRRGSVGQDAAVNIVDGRNLGDALSEALGGRLDPEVTAALLGLGKTFGDRERASLRRRVRDQLARGASGRCTAAGNRYREIVKAILAKQEPPDPDCTPINVADLADEIAGEAAEEPTTSTEGGETAPPPEGGGGDSEVPGRWTGTFQFADAEQTVTANEIALDVAQDGTGGEFEFRSEGVSSIGSSELGKNCTIISSRFPPDLATDLEAGTVSGTIRVEVLFELTKGCAGGSTTRFPAQLDATIRNGTMKGTLNVGGELNLPFTATKTG